MWGSAKMIFAVPHGEANAGVGEDTMWALAKGVRRFRNRFYLEPIP